MGRIVCVGKLNTHIAEMISSTFFTICEYQRRKEVIDGLLYFYMM